MQIEPDLLNTGNSKPNVAVVTWPIHQSGIIPLQNLVKIINNLANEIEIITGAAGNQILNPDSKIRIHSVDYKLSKNTVGRIINNMIMQVKISWKLVKIIRKVDFCIFFYGGPLLILPMITARLCRKKVILHLAGSEAQDANMQHGSLVGQQAKVITKINYILASRIVIYSENLIKEWGLSKYRKKISIAHEHVLDLARFNISKPLKDRKNTMGYFGRHSKEKGVLNFAQAVAIVVKQESQLKFFIGGGGPLTDEVKRYIQKHNLGNTVNLIGWIPHDELYKYLNDLRLIVIPSYTEGLPNIMLEAMACGTPVLSTPVGAIPDIIKDGETGYIMTDNSPECIAANVIRVMNSKNLEQIIKNARIMVESEYSLDNAVKKYKKIFSDITASPKS